MKNVIIAFTLGLLFLDGYAQGESKSLEEIASFESEKISGFLLLSPIQKEQVYTIYLRALLLENSSVTNRRPGDIIAGSPQRREIRKILNPEQKRKFNESMNCTVPQGADDSEVDDI